MKNYLLLIAMSAVIVLTGCSTSIADYVITTRDKEVYKSSEVTAKDYKNAGYVLETRGYGEVACVNLGKKDGVKKGTKIAFFTIIQRIGKRYKISFAEGRVFQVGDESSWVEINSYETAGIKENHFAKIAADQSYTFGEKMAFPPRFWQK